MSHKVLHTPGNKNLHHSESHLVTRISKSGEGSIERFVRSDRRHYFRHGIDGPTELRTVEI